MDAMLIIDPDPRSPIPGGPSRGKALALGRLAAGGGRGRVGVFFFRGRGGGVLRTPAPFRPLGDFPFSPPGRGTTSLGGNRSEPFRFTRHEEIAIITID